MIPYKKNENKKRGDTMRFYLLVLAFSLLYFSGKSADNPTPLPSSSTLVCDTCLISPIVGVPFTEVCNNCCFSISTCADTPFSLTVYSGTSTGITILQSSTEQEVWALDDYQSNLPDGPFPDPQLIAESTSVGYELEAKICLDPNYNGPTQDLTFVQNSEDCPLPEEGAVFEYSIPNIDCQLDVQTGPSGISIAEVCTEDLLYFELEGLCGNPISALVTWSYSDDDGQTWNSIPGIPFNSTCFNFPAINLDNICTGEPFVNRIFRAELSSLGFFEYSCTFYDSLTICCPWNVSLDLSPDPDLCEGDTSTLTATLQTSFNLADYPEIPPVQWFVGGIAQPQWEGLETVQISMSDYESGNYTVNVSLTPCNNCLGLNPSASFNLGVRPTCPPIVGETELCPGEAAELMFVGENATPVWEVAADSFFTAPMTLGLTNTTQNTNALLPDWFPPDLDTVYYRVIGEVGPDAGACLPCTTYAHPIHIIPTPEIPVIVGEEKICSGDFTVLSVEDIDPFVLANGSYTWEYNGLPYGTGTSVPAFEPGVYRVYANNGCEEVESEAFILEVCFIQPILICPTCVNAETEQLNLNACLSFSSCGHTLTSFEWSTGQSGCSVIVNGPFSGDLYYAVTITDSFGCTQVGELNLKVCE
jgi:hypothetical protein